jgi:hypothetical protein
LLVLTPPRGGGVPPGGGGGVPAVAEQCEIDVQELLLSSVMYMLSRAFGALCISTTQLYHCLTNQYFILRESRVNLVFNRGRPKFPCLNTRATGQGGNFRLSRLKRNFELSGCRFSLLGKQNVKHGMTNESAHVSPREGDDAETAGINSKISFSVLTPAPLRCHHSSICSWEVFQL